MASKGEGFTATVDISGVAGYIIGRRGATVREMEHATGARIIIDDKNVGKEIASISASSQAVLNDAVAKVKQAVTDARAAPARPAPAFVQQIALTTDQAGAVIGKGGATIQDIRTRTGANVKVVSRNRQQFAMIEAADTKSGQNAENEVRKVINAAATGAVARPAREERSPRAPREARAPRERPAPAAGSPSKSFGLPDPSMTVVVVGPRGATIRALEDETGAQIEVDRETGRVTVTGATQSIVDNAVNRVNATVSGLVKCTSGAACGGWARRGEMFCPRCERTREGGERADAEGFEKRRERRDGARSREQGRAGARDAKAANREY